VLRSTVNGDKANGTASGEGGGIARSDRVLTVVAGQGNSNEASTAFAEIFVGP
jgi:hypothetical protein